MAGDWIKMRTNLDSDVRVIEIANELNMTEMHVIGCLWKLWSWADQHTHDGNAIRVTSVTLDRFTGVTGFADALRKVDWLAGRDGALTFPRFVEHNGQTAKKRAETKERVARHRNAKCVTDVTQNPLPEKRREEKRRDSKKNTKKEISKPDDVPQDVWDDFLAIRKAKRLPLTQTAMEGIRREAAKAGWDLERVIRKCCTRGWASFDSAWLDSSDVQQESRVATAADFGEGGYRP